MASSKAPMKILIVEDHTHLRRLMALSVGRQHDVVGACDATAGWEAALEMRPDVALLDVALPGLIDGLDLCRLIKADPRTSHAKVVLISGRNQSSDVLVGKAAGADEYVVKPFSPSRIAEMVDEIEAAH
jgi:DNA-binding response OmpR family regulator